MLETNLRFYETRSLFSDSIIDLGCQVSIMCKILSGFNKANAFLKAFRQENIYKLRF
jgi:hypothetical protein